MRLSHFLGFGLLGAGWVAGAVAEPDPAGPPAQKEDPTDGLYQAGKDLFDSYATPEMKEQFAFPDKARWDEFAARLQKALEGDRFDELAKYEPEARTALVALRALPGSEEYVAWLEGRLDYIEAAQQIARLPPPTAPVARPTQSVQFIPHFDLWLQRVQTRRKPPGADEIIPLVEAVFAAAGVPAELAWLAEVESTLNPSARSPAGARGLFQLMPGTAKEMGLSTFLPDERTDPKKSAQAAAQLLRALHEKFGDWPLALAAYNAGAGRVQRTLEHQKASSFAGIASALPVETRMYVPKVLATLQVRTGVSLAGPAPPGV
jgi:membrane-bound lytic murein transglycosylase D